MQAPVTTERHFRYWSWWLLLYAAAWGLTYGVLAREPIALFRHNAVFILVGFCGAVLGNISAVGGGIVFIPVMIFVFHIGAVDALKIALASQAFGMTSGAIGWIQKKCRPAARAEVDRARPAARAAPSARWSSTPAHCW